MKKSTSSIIFTMSAAGIFVGTQDASASELENQQKTTAATTNEMNQNDNKVAQSSDNQQQKESYTAAKEQPKLPNQSTSNQYNPGNNQHWENEAGKTDDATSEHQPEEQQ